MSTSKIITASAGSGKTYSVTTELLRLLLSNSIDPSSILVTTFTKKAAEEIFSRLISRILQAINNEDNFNNLKTQIQLPSLTPELIKKQLFKIIERQNNLKIQTIDSFFVSLGQCFANELKIPLQWSISDDWQTEEIELLALDSTFKEVGIDKLNLLLPLVFREAESSRIFTVLSKQISIFQKELFFNTKESWGCEFSCLKTKTEDKNIELIEQKINNWFLEEKVDKRVVKSIQNFIKKFEDKDWEGMFKAKLSDSLLEDGKTYSTILPKDIHDLLLNLLHIAIKIVASDINNQSLSLAAIFSEFTKIKKQIGEKHSLLSFQELSQRLAEIPEIENLNELYYRLDSKINYLFIDEFQDTSAVQWKILSPLAEEIVSEPSGRRALITVGDSKQAIYGWRGGLSNIFTHLESQFPTLPSIPLFESYRSTKIIIDFVNQIFTRPCLPDHYQEVTESWANKFVKHESKLEKNFGAVKILGIKKSDDKNETILEKLNTVKYLINDELSKNNNSTIGILTRSNSQANLIETFLSKQGIKASSISKTLLTSFYLPQLYISLLTLAEHPGDALSYHHILANKLLKNKFGNITISKLSHRLKNRIFTKGLTAFTREIHNILSPELTSLENKIIYTITSLAAGCERKQGPNISSLIRNIKNYNLNSNENSRVNILTIHKSKGLEFDHIIIPFSEDHFFRDQNLSLLKKQTDPFEAPTSIVKSNTSAIRKFIPEMSDMADNARKAKISEALCLSYVAITRAKERLSILLELNPKGIGENETSLRSILTKTLNLDISKNDSCELYGHIGIDSIYEKETKNIIKNPVIPRVIKQIEFNGPLYTLKKSLKITNPSQVTNKKLSSLKEFFKENESDASNLGLEVHQVLEKLNRPYTDLLEIKEELNNSILKNKSTQCQEIINSFFNSEVAKDIFVFNNPNEETETLNEYSIKGIIGKELVVGRIDRIVIKTNIITKDKKVLIYDFKLNEIDIESGKIQIEFYKKLLNKNLKINLENIFTYLVSIINKKII